MKAYSYFVGKTCSVFVTPTAWKIDPKRYVDYFVGTVESVDSDALVLSSAVNGAKTLVRIAQIISVCEEVVAYGDSEETLQKAAGSYDESREKVYSPNPIVLPDAALSTTPPIDAKIEPPPRIKIDNIPPRIKIVQSEGPNIDIKGLADLAAKGD